MIQREPAAVATLARLLDSRFPREMPGNEGHRYPVFPTALQQVVKGRDLTDWFDHHVEFFEQLAPDGRRQHFPKLHLTSRPRPPPLLVRGLPAALREEHLPLRIQYDCTHSNANKRMPRSFYY